MRISSRGIRLVTIVLPAAPVWSWIVAFGEMFVGVALILGIFTGLAATGGFRAQIAELQQAMMVPDQARLRQRSSD